MHEDGGHLSSYCLFYPGAGRLKKKMDGKEYDVMERTLDSELDSNPTWTIYYPRQISLSI